MFTARKPDGESIEHFLKAQEAAQLTYSPVGLSSLSPRGFTVDVDRIILGRGHDVFVSATGALRSWRHFQLSWIELQPSAPPMCEGSTVAILAHHLGFWSLNACRVVQLFSETHEAHRWGFSYGTLDGHSECGEERFIVEMDPTDETVVYEVRAVSRPHAALAWLGYPVARKLQSRFRRESGLALREAVEKAAPNTPMQPPGFARG
jgi:uncharacterized protein (UPF0548 family)